MRSVIDLLFRRRRGNRRSWHYGLVRIAEGQIGLCEVHLRDGEPVAHSEPVTFEAFNDHLVHHEKLLPHEREEALRQSIIWQLKRALRSARTVPIIGHLGRGE